MVCLSLFGKLHSTTDKQLISTDAMIKIMRYLTIVLIYPLFAFPLVTSADIYKYTAPDGKIYYTDKPKHKYYKRLIRSRPHNYQQSLAYYPQNKKKYTSIIKAAAAKHQLDPNLLHAVIYAESAYNATAVSSAGAVGLMQLMPATAKRYGVTNRHDPAQNINGGARYLKDLLKLFKFNTRLAVAAYNAGEGAVKKYNNSVPPYPETQRYVNKVMRIYQST